MREPEPPDASRRPAASGRAPAREAAPPPTWEVFVRVIDNRGDAGVGWRLARHLARRSQRVRLWIDDAGALNGMADAADRALVHGGRIEVRSWPRDGDRFALAPGAIAVVEAFGCALPDAVLAALAPAGQAGGPAAPVWINLEYLSAEPYVERSHRLPSPRHDGPAAGSVLWFFYPGFSERTGGLLRDADPQPPAPQAPAVVPSAHARTAAAPGPLRISRFDYRPGQALAWLADWANTWTDTGQGPGLQCLEPGTLPGPGRPPARLGPDPTPRLERIALPWLTQSAYDTLLASCELNIVRGEDSFVRAQWAGRPLIWQAYPQHDGAHAGKLQAWLDAYLAGCDPALASVIRQVHAMWNGLEADGLPPADAAAPAGQDGQGRQTWRIWAGLDRPALDRWTEHARRWRLALAGRPDLADALIEFVTHRRGPLEATAALQRARDGTAHRLG